MIRHKVDPFEMLEGLSDFSDRTQVFLRGVNFRNDGAANADLSAHLLPPPPPLQNGRKLHAGQRAVFFRIRVFDIPQE